jgi:oligopeptide transport system permease protein
MMIMVVLVIVGPLLSPFAIDQTDWYQLSAKPSFSSGHIFGTDDLGRDLFVGSNIKFICSCVRIW